MQTLKAQQQHLQHHDIGKRVCNTSVGLGGAVAAAAATATAAAAAAAAPPGQGPAGSRDSQLGGVFQQPSMDGME